MPTHKQALKLETILGGSFEPSECPGELSLTLAHHDPVWSGPVAGFVPQLVEVYRCERCRTSVVFRSGKVVNVYPEVRPLDLVEDLARALARPGDVAEPLEVAAFTPGEDSRGD